MGLLAMWYSLINKWGIIKLRGVHVCLIWIWWWFEIETIIAMPVNTDQWPLIDAWSDGIQHTHKKIRILCHKSWFSLFYRHYCTSLTISMIWIFCESWWAIFFFDDQQCAEKMMTHLTNIHTKPNTMKHWDKYNTRAQKVSIM